MRFNRNNLFIASSTLALVIVLVIQANWLFNTARLKEELFNEKAALVLARTTDALLADTLTLSKSGKQDFHKIDSLLKHYMMFYNFQMAYTFEVIPPISFQGTIGEILKAKRDSINALQYNNYPPQPGCYKEGFDRVSMKNGYGLKLFFPEKNQFIRQEMSGLFIASILLVLVVLLMFWRTVASLQREKRLSEHTMDFLNNMTHEFKTPLTNIALAGRMLTKDPTLRQEEKLKHYAEIILSENEKLRQQVEQVLSMSALEKGKIPLRQEKLSFHQLIKACVKNMSMQLDNKQGHIELYLEAVQEQIKGDKAHLMNALCNLIDNAIKYSYGVPEITLHTYNTGNYIVLVISDKGIGIEEQYQQKVFDKYFRVPTGDVHDVKGFGLGLSYVKKIVELHLGNIMLKSEKTEDIYRAAQPGTGTSFTIALPYA